MTELVVNTTNGKVEGFIKDDISRWYGVPYGKPPIEELRFRRAVKCDPWDDVKKCTEFRGRPPQFKNADKLGKSTDTEDCLYLNIWKKNNTAAEDKNLPVFVYFHGGYLLITSAVDLPYSCDTFARDGVLYITVGYRLGPLGCYDFSIYDKEAFDSNCCLSDQLLAMQWIKENIANFGGDPNNITVGGSSSGAESVLALMACPAAKGLFQKAVCQSAYPDAFHSPRSNKLLMDMFLEHLQLKPEEASKIRDLDVKTLQEATNYVSNNLSRYPGIFWPNFVYDDLLPENCYTSLKNGSADGVKLIIGTCKNESSLFRLSGECTKTLEDVKKMFENNQRSDDFATIEDFYFTQKKGGDSDPVLNFATDYLFFLGSTEVADILSERQQDVWMYRFDFVPPMLKLSGYNAAHCVDLPIAFDCTEDLLGKLFWMLAKPSSRKLLVNLFHHSLVNFIKTGDPNGEHLPLTWEKYEKEKRKTFLVDKPPSLVENPSKENIELWENKLKSHRFYL